MPVLILFNVTPATPARGMVLSEPSRVVFGRRPFNTVLIPDNSVSRIHAWIGHRAGDERFTLYDAGSRSGTLLNGQAVREPRALHHGDKIRIGPATVVYYDDDALPAEMEAFDPPPAPPAADPYDGGIYFDCPCGGPMWVTADLAGAAGRCRYCGQRLLVPHLSGSTARPVVPEGPPVGSVMAARPRVVPKPAARKLPTPPVAPPAPVSVAVDTPASNVGQWTLNVNRTAAPIAPPAPAITRTAEAATCSICQTALLADEEQKACPSCGLTFHAGCWEENFGCSAYGCDQVNILNPDEPVSSSGEAGAGNGAYPAAESAAAGSDDVAEAPVAIVPKIFPIETLLLALSFVAMGLGALLYGIPSSVVLVWGIMTLFARKPVRKALVLTAILVSVAGVLAGLVTSMFWWKGMRLWEMVMK